MKSLLFFLIFLTIVAVICKAFEALWALSPAIAFILLYVIIVQPGGGASE